MDPFLNFMGQLMKTTSALFEGLYQFDPFRFLLTGINHSSHIPGQSFGNPSHKDHVFEPFAFRTVFQNLGLLPCLLVGQCL